MARSRRARIPARTHAHAGALTVGTTSSILPISAADLAALSAQAAFRVRPQVVLPAPTPERRADWKLLNAVEAQLATTASPTILAASLAQVEGAAARALARLEQAERDQARHADADDPERAVALAQVVELEREEHSTWLTLIKLRRVLDGQARSAARDARRARFAAEATRRGARTPTP